uniref:Uncharacterized protein n=1 Tax=Palpitomonas bilix TaxID=652834 RepID=A0A7S3FZB5_9EUKA|mmetsp:Transcript_12280/g.32950  ORF Transcript_12280/g.32950 Transcript_12280/m.32950 type:complete len:148 (+) Transcript_12280:73-516(+)
MNTYLFYHSAVSTDDANSYISLLGRLEQDMVDYFGVKGREGAAVHAFDQWYTSTLEHIANAGWHVLLVFDCVDSITPTSSNYLPHSLPANVQLIVIGCPSFPISVLSNRAHRVFEQRGLMCDSEEGEEGEGGGGGPPGWVGGGFTPR